MPEGLELGIAIFFILEGIMPFIAPQIWRRSLLKITTLKDKQIQLFGLFMLVGGCLILYSNT